MWMSGFCCALVSGYRWLGVSLEGECRNSLTWTFFQRRGVCRNRGRRGDRRCEMSLSGLSSGWLCCARERRGDVYFSGCFPGDLDSAMRRGDRVRPDGGALRVGGMLEACWFWCSRGALFSEFPSLTRGVPSYSIFGRCCKIQKSRRNFQGEIQNLLVSLIKRTSRSESTGLAGSPSSRGCSIFGARRCVCAFYKVSLGQTLLCLAASPLTAGLRFLEDRRTHPLSSQQVPSRNCAATLPWLFPGSGRED